MSLFEEIKNKREKIAIIGLGYVGMPLAFAFSKKARVIGYDLDREKIQQYKSGIDPTEQISYRKLQDSKIEFTYRKERLREARFHIVTVPTPINTDKTPNLEPIKSASRTIGQNLEKGSIVVYESTVYPGVTEDICIPILEEESGLKCGRDFKVGYSPERINPGDQVNTLENIVKIVSAIDQETTDEIAKTYGLIISAKIHKTSSIKVAEAAKIVENSQRDINIAFMNELAMVFDRMDIDTNEVIEAMNTKWNALGFYPGLVGGHCIGIDPYYFIYEAEKLGYHSQIILSGRKINDGMGEFVTNNIIKRLVLTDKVARESKIGLLGITFKEDISDTRNSQVIDIIYNLREYGIEPIVVDPIADKEQVEKVYNISLSTIDKVKDIDCLILAVGHKEFRQLSLEEIDSFFKPLPNKEKIIIDIQSILDKEDIREKGYDYWSL